MAIISSARIYTKATAEETRQRVGNNALPKLGKAQMEVGRSSFSCL